MGDYRLLVVSSRARNKIAIFNSVLANLVLVDYNYETTTLEELLQKILKALGGAKVASMAMVLHTSERELFICGPGPAFISLKSLISDRHIKDFLQQLAKQVLDLANWSARLDFLATYAAVNLDGALISKEITSIMGCQVCLSSDLAGSDVQTKSKNGKVVALGEIYFDLNKLRAHLQTVGKVGKQGAKKLQK